MVSFEGGGGRGFPGTRSASFMEANDFVSYWVSEIIMGRP